MMSEIMKRFLTISFFVLLLASTVLLGCRPQAEEQGQAATATPGSADTDANPTEAAPVAAGVVILTEGQLVAVNPVLPLAFEAGGRLLTLNVRPGDTIAAGDLIATLDDDALQDAVTSAELQLSLAENSLAQAQASLDELLDWEVDEFAVALAEANLAAAQANLENAENQDAAAGNSLTSVFVAIEQAERAVAQAQEAYNRAHDPGRDWELNDPFRADFLKAEREGTANQLAFAQENLQVAQAQYSVTAAGINNDSALNAQISIASAQQALDQAQRGPTEAQIVAAELRVEQAELSLEQSQFSLSQAEAALAEAQLLAPWSGTVLSVEVAPGAFVGAGSPVITLLDTANLQFHTSNLSERDLAQVQPGQPAEIILKSYPDRPLTGTVAGIAPQASGTLGDAAVFTVQIDLEADDLVLRPGMTGRAEITRE